ncbi:MAG TPA: glycoside hydrolase family 16 protein, partial [Novosphingobium sp.]|nr:glycoside hydrolase family 16 protein [Novosphingobium sp.]
MTLLAPSRLIAAGLAAALAAAAATAQPAATPAAPAAQPAKPAATEPHRQPKGYVLVFADEFDGTGLPDPAKWAYDTHRNQQGWYNQEKQYYSAARSENSRLENGRLVIEARAETLDRARFPDWGGQSYTSARLFTQGRAAWTYGFFEIRAKLPCGVGTWPAIWMLPEDP